MIQRSSQLLAQDIYIYIWSHIKTSPTCIDSNIPKSVARKRVATNSFAPSLFPLFFAMSRAWAWYNAHLAARPLRTRMITSLTLFTVGDFISQHGIERRSGLWPESWSRNRVTNDKPTASHAASTSFKEPSPPSGHDYSRTSRLAFYGCFIFAPLLHTWLGFLDRRVRIPRHPRLTIVARVVADLGLWGPFIVSVFWSSQAVLEGKAWAAVQAKWANAFVPSLSKSILVFGPTQIVNFSIVPAQHRMLVSQCVGLGWNTFLSYSNNRSNHAAAAAAAATAFAEISQHGAQQQQHVVNNGQELAVSVPQRHDQPAATAKKHQPIGNKVMLALEQGERAIQDRVEGAVAAAGIRRTAAGAASGGTTHTNEGGRRGLALDQIGI